MNGDVKRFNWRVPIYVQFLVMIRYGSMINMYPLHISYFLYKRIPSLVTMNGDLKRFNWKVQRADDKTHTLTHAHAHTHTRTHTHTHTHIYVCIYIYIYMLT